MTNQLDKKYLFSKNMKFNFLFHFKKDKLILIEKNNEFKSIIPTDKKNLNSIKKRIKNSLTSFLRGFICIIEVIGLGFSVSCKKNCLRLNIGFNHSIYFQVNAAVAVRTKRKAIFLFSHSFFLLRTTVTILKNFRKLSIYKLKGIKEKDALYKKKNWKKNIL